MAQGSSVTASTRTPLVRNQVLSPLAFLAIALTSVACQAIDNPDAPNYLEEFRSEASAYERAIFEESQTTSDSMEAYREYIAFLESELEAATSALRDKLSGAEEEAFEKSISAWEMYRTSEKGFISTVWRACKPNCVTAHD